MIAFNRKSGSHQDLQSVNDSLHQSLGKCKMVPAEERFSQLTSGPLFPGPGSGGGGQGFGPVLPV